MITFHSLACMNYLMSQLLQSCGTITNHTHRKGTSFHKLKTWREYRGRAPHANLETQNVSLWFQEHSLMSQYEYCSATSYLAATNNACTLHLYSESAFPLLSLIVLLECMAPLQSLLTRTIKSQGHKQPFYEHMVTTHQWLRGVPNCFYTIYFQRLVYLST